jgi:anti-sigma B factor antagonist
MGIAMGTQAIQMDPNRTQIVEIVGRIDNAQSATLAQYADSALSHGRTHLILDMSAVSFINSSGLRALVGIVRRAQAADGSLTILNPSERVAKVLGLVGLDTVFRIIADPQWKPPQLSTASIARQMCILA